MLSVPNVNPFASVIATSKAPVLVKLTAPTKLFNACVRVIAAPPALIFEVPPIVSAAV